MLLNDDDDGKILEEQEVPEEMIHSTIKAAVLKRELTPVYMGSAFKNKGVQALLRRCL